MRAIRRSRCGILVTAQLCTILVAGCVSAPRSNETLTLFRTGVTDADVQRRHVGPATLTRADLLLPNVLTTLDAVRRLRPDFLQGSARGPRLGPPEIATYINDMYDGDIAALDLVPLSEIQEIRFLHPVEAQFRFGITCRCANGAIVVITRRARSPE